MTKEEIIRNLKYTMERHKNDTVNTFGTNISVMCKDILDYLEQEPCEDCISRQNVLDMVEDMTDQFGNKHRVVTEGMISLLPSVTPKSKTDVLDKIRAEIKEWYWQADKQALAEDPCVVDAMIDLFIRTIDKYTAESEETDI